MMTRRGRVATAAVLGFAAMVGCHDSSGVDLKAPTQVAGAAGDGQEAEVNTQLPNPLVVVVKNVADAPIEAVTVQFYVVAGGGSVGSSSAKTDVGGKASTSYQLGPQVGTQVVEAAVPGATGSPVRFQIKANGPEGGGGGGGGQ